MELSFRVINYYKYLREFHFNILINSLLSNI